MSKHNGIFICGYCNKETPLADDQLVEIIEDVYGLTIHQKLCSCGCVSFDSRIRFQASINTNDWRFVTCQGK